MHRIGEDRTKQLDIVPRAAAGHSLRAPQISAPQVGRRCVSRRAIVRHWSKNNDERPACDKGRHPLAHVLDSKSTDRVPLYRQGQIRARATVKLHRSTLADWIATAAFDLGAAVDRLPEHLKMSTKLFMAFAGNRGPRGAASAR